MSSVWGNAVRSRRISLGLGLDAVAMLGGMSAAKVEAIEAGAPLSVSELERIAAALATEPAALRRGETEGDPSRGIARFRAPLAGGLPSPADIRTLARATEAGRVHAFLWDLLRGASQVRALRRVLSLDTSKKPWEQGYDLGAQARERLVPARRAIPSVQRLFEERGVLVLMLPLESASIEAASLAQPDASPVVVLNTSLPRMRSPLPRRAALAHELCHLLHDSSAERDLCTVLSERDSVDPIEQRASGFAPSFLAPKAWVHRGTGALPAAVRRLGESWGLSFEGAAWHAKNLRWCGHEEAAALIGEHRDVVISTPFEPDVERVDASRAGIEVMRTPFSSSSLGDLAIEAAEKGDISSGRAAEIIAFR
ncbi:MAG: ImmA/IrrE family metallo-endopeptidase [Deltaproteobacteria bacterium]|nr:ImmA/IrrE family metallo-endopeptidase [Myxococcales bacterium]MDP3219838.1 ImmA/IrrE family metallo-endopeptidase [Deltaproteobacteria bacterium]